MRIAEGGVTRGCEGQSRDGDRTPHRTGACSKGGFMSGKYVLTKGPTGKYHFNLVASNGQVVVTSQHYENRESALHGIKSVQANAATEKIEDETER